MAQLETAKYLVRSRSRGLELLFRFDRSGVDYLELVHELASVAAEQGAELREVHPGLYRVVDPVTSVLSTDGHEVAVKIRVENAVDLENALDMVRSRSGSEQLVFRFGGAAENRRRLVDEIGRCALRHGANLEKVDFGMFRLTEESVER